MIVISPNTLLLGRISDTVDNDDNYEDRPVLHASQLQLILGFQWSVQCWYNIFPNYRKKYLVVNTSLKVGDICALSYKHKLGKDFSIFVNDIL